MIHTMPCKLSMQILVKTTTWQLYFSLPILVSISILSLGISIHAQNPSEMDAIDRINPPIFGFYVKAMHCGGITVRGSAHLRDDSILTICNRAKQLLSKSDSLQQNMAQRGVELHVVAIGEAMPLLPELSGKDESNFSNRSLFQPGLYRVCFETKDERTMLNQCTSQIALSMMLYGFDSAMRRNIQAQFQSARTLHLWNGLEAGVDAQEYWSQLSAWYFGGRGNCPDTSLMCPNSGVEALKSYDRGGYLLLHQLYEGIERPKAVTVMRARSVSKLAISSMNPVPAELQVVNNSGHLLYLSKMDPYGHITQAGELGPFNRTVLSTSLFQVWIVSNQKKIELDRFIVEDSLCEYISEN